MKKTLLAGAALSAIALSQSVDVVVALDRVEVMQENAANRQELRQERRDTILENIANRVEERFTRHEERLQNWIERATKHIDDREAKGKDMTAAKAALENAKISLATSTQLGADAVAKLRAVTPEDWTAQKADAVAAREAVKKAQIAYAQVVKDMYTTLAAIKKAA